MDVANYYIHYFFHQQSIVLPLKVIYIQPLILPEFKFVKNSPITLNLPSISSNKVESIFNFSINEQKEEEFQGKKVFVLVNFNFFVPVDHSQRCSFSDNF